jgi:PiT family inorganic phosphate transporter
VATPVIAALVALLGLFFLQNVFSVVVRRPVPYELTREAVERLADQGAWDPGLAQLTGTRFGSEMEFGRAVSDATGLDARELEPVFTAAEVDSFVIDPLLVDGLDGSVLRPSQIEAVRALSRRAYRHKWELQAALAARSGDWAPLPEAAGDRARGKALESELRYVFDTFRVPARVP